jgi:hypothetical protein
MAEQKGIIVEYNPTNRQGKVRALEQTAETKGLEALFYLTSVTNADPLPKAKDIVIFSAPAPRKNKKGKFVQENATSVTIEERAPEPSPQELAARKQREERSKGNSRFTGNRDRKQNNKNRSRENHKRDRPDKVFATEGVSTDLNAKKPEKRIRNNNALKKPNNKPSISDRIQYPLGRDIPANILHMEQSNPGLVLEKYIQWPKTQMAKNDSLQNKNTWQLLDKHKKYFLSRTVSEIYRNFERRSLPWSAVRSSREAMLSSLERSGYTIASEIIKGPWCFGVSGITRGVIDDALLCFDKVFGFPYIPASNIKRLLNSYLKSDKANNIDPQLKKLALENSASVLIFDIVPTTRLGQFAIQQANCVYPKFNLNSETIQHLPQEAYAFVTGEDAAFSVSIAIKDPLAERAGAKQLLLALVDAIKLANSLAVATMDKYQTATAVVF